MGALGSPARFTPGECLGPGNDVLPFGDEVVAVSPFCLRRKVAAGAPVVDERGVARQHARLAAKTQP